jgi:hypothetical protein
MHIKVENHPDLVRDSTSNAILNTDVAAFEAHLKQREKFNKIDSLSNRMDSLEQQLDQIISLLSMNRPYTAY